MLHRHLSRDNQSVVADTSDPGEALTRRTALRCALIGPFGGLVSGLLLGISRGGAEASPIDPNQTIIVLPEDIKWVAWSGLPDRSAEVATIYGDLDKAGPYVVFMKWYPGYMSAPHMYATDRLSVVVSGTWWVNSGKDFDPDHCVSVPTGGFVRRVARTLHYDGVKKDSKEPAVIAIFGTGPVDFEAGRPSQTGLA